MSTNNFVSSFNSIKLRFVTVCEHHPLVRKMLLPMRKAWQKLGIGRYTRNLEQDRKILHEECVRYYEHHKQDFVRLSALLEDNLSRYTLERILAFWKSWDMSLLKDIYRQPQYFQKDIFCSVKDEVFVDGGAYVGDTIDSFRKDFAGVKYRKIYAWEPDKANMTALKKNTGSMKNIEYVPYGLWSEEAELSFLSDGTGSSKISDNNEQHIKVKVNCIDNICSSDKVTFIKMDIEGSEMEALKGAVNVIKRDKPRLAICIYHKPEDLYEIPIWIKETVPEYRLFMRQHSLDYGETVIYATL